MSQKLIQLLQPLVEELTYEFVGLEYSGSKQNGTLRIYIDQQPAGISVEDCETVSREVAALLDVEDPIPGQYNLEVSSPGLDRPLFTLEQFAQFSGHEAKVRTFAPIDGRRKFTGDILRVGADAVVLNQDGSEVEIPHENIAKARLVPDFDQLLADHEA